MKITIDENRRVLPKTVILGVCGEIATRSMEIDAPTISGAALYVMRFAVPSGVVYETEIDGGNVTIPAAVLAETGCGLMQWVARGSSGQLIAKSETVGYAVMQSVGDEISALPAPEDTESAIERINKAVADGLKQFEGLEFKDGNIQEVIDARKGTLVANTFASLAARLSADFNACITQGELEKAIGNAIIQANNTGVGRFWRDADGVAHGEIFNDYSGNEASGDRSHAEGCDTTASHMDTHAEGANTIASAPSAHAEGGNCIASGTAAHAEGGITEASGQYAHSEGANTKASGKAAHSEGNGTEASGMYSHAEGDYTIAASKDQHAGGKYNIADATNTYAVIIGNGTSKDARSNALTLDWYGNLRTAGDVTATDTSGNAVGLVSTAEAVTAAEKTLKNNDAITRSTLGTSRKNLLKNTAGTTTQNGITFTCNEDGSVTCSGTATADTNYRYQVTLDANTSYTLTGCPEGGSTTTYNLFIMNVDGWNKINRDLGSGKTFDTGESTDWHAIIRIASGQTVDGLTFYPMLRYADIEDGTYEPYVDDLQTQINALKAAIESLGGTVSAATE